MLLLSVSDSYSEHVPTLTPGEISRRFCSWPSSESSESIIKRFHQTFVSSPLHWSAHREISQSYFHLQMVITSGTPQAHYVYSTLKRLGNSCFHVTLMWNTRTVFVGYTSSCIESLHFVCQYFMLRRFCHGCCSLETLGFRFGWIWFTQYHRHSLFDIK